MEYAYNMSSNALQTDRRARSDAVASPQTAHADGRICPGCGGTGFCRPADGSFHRATLCVCRQREKAKETRRVLFETAQIQALHEKTFATFDDTRPGVQDSFCTAASYALNPTGWLVLSGPAGCGKTHLAAACLWYVWECFPDVTMYFTEVSELLERLRGGYDPDAEIRYEELLMSVRSVGMLLLDNLGGYRRSPWAEEKLYQIINFRYNAAMPTICTMTPSAWRSLSPRITSRLSDIHLVTRIDMYASTS